MHSTKCLINYLINHRAFVKHVWVEEAVSEPYMIGHFFPIRGHSGQHWADERVTESEGSSGKLIKDARVACHVEVVRVSFRLHSQIVQIHVVPSNDSGQKFVECDVLVDG